MICLYLGEKKMSKKLYEFEYGDKTFQVGIYEDDKRHGYFTVTYPNGGKYVGDKVISILEEEKENA
jgi:hypothetical protein